MIDPPPSTSPAAASRVHPATRWALATVAVALAVAGIGGWLDARRSANSLRHDMARELAVAHAVSDQANARIATLASDLRDAQAKLALLDTRQTEAQTQQAALENFYRDLSPSRDDLALTEVEQTLNLASQQLALAGNVQSALAALQLTDAKLARLERPRFAPLRRALAVDMERLKAVPYIDVAGLAGKLDAAITEIGALPLAHDERVPEPVPAPDALVAAGGWRQFLRGLWSDARSMVRIETSERPAAPLLLPSQQYFLRENLRLRLLSARNALLARNDASFRSDVKASDAWVRQFFDVRAKPVQSLLASLAQLKATSLPSNLPELTHSLAAAAALRAALDRDAMRPADRAAPR
ncbi:MAG: uroporphyrinogen-III C-methyltransferase [Casimicrobiaceae bacterium]